MESCLPSKVIGFDTSPEAVASARQKGWISSSVDHISELAEVDLIILATPPDSTVRILAEIEPLISPTTILTDCSSVKRSIVDAVPASLLPRFVGGHPMAGHHESGYASAQLGLFTDCQWILTPQEETDPAALRLVRRIVFALDAHPVEMDPDSHDRHVAALSHLPHILANALLCMSADLDHPEIAAGSWSDLTRVGGTEPDLWRQILIHNRGKVLESLEALQQYLDGIRATLEEGNGSEIADEIRRAASHKR